MTEKHHVVISKSDLEEYEGKGYRRVEGESLAEHVGAGWSLLPRDEQQKLCLVGIDKAQHQAQNSPPRAFYVDMHYRHMIGSAELLKLDVLERSDRDTLCASAEVDTGPRWYPSDHLGEEARQAVGIARPFIIDVIAEHRRIADELESFLMGMEAL